MSNRIALKFPFLACLAFSFLFVSGLLAQGSVPYRVGDKFGIADLSGKMVVPAEYDLIEMDNYSKLHFIAYKFRDTGNVSSLIINNTVVIKDQSYRDYSLTNELIVANGYDLKAGKRSYSNPYDQKSRLFSITGKDILNETFSYISVINDIDEKNKLDEVLVVTTGADKRKSILIYDKKLEKISRTIAAGVIDLEVPEQYNNSYTENAPIVYVYRDALGNWQKSAIEGSGKVIKAETVKIASDWKKERAGFDDFGSLDAVEMPRGDRPAAEKTDNAKKIEVDLDKYYLPRKMEKIATSFDGFKNGYVEVVKKAGKQGLLLIDKNEMLIPARYDEIMDAEFNHNASGCIIRTGNKYGLYLFGEKTNMMVEPVFAYIPLVEEAHYFGTGQPLIKLFDPVTGELFCYASKSGKLYYREK